MFEDEDGLSFWDSGFGFDFLLEFASVAELHDDEFEVFVLVDVVAFDDVVAVADHHQLGLGLAESFFYLFDLGVGFFVYLVEVDDFDGY